MKLLTVLAALMLATSAKGQGQSRDFKLTCDLGLEVKHGAQRIEAAKETVLLDVQEFQNTFLIDGQSSLFPIVATNLQNKSRTVVDNSTADKYDVLMKTGESTGEKLFMLSLDRTTGNLIYAMNTSGLLEWRAKGLCKKLDAQKKIF